MSKRATDIERDIAVEAEQRDPVVIELRLKGSMFRGRDRALGLIYELERECFRPVDAVDFTDVDASGRFLGEFFRGIRVHNDLHGSREFPELRNVSPEQRQEVEWGLWAAHLEAEEVTIIESVA